MGVKLTVKLNKDVIERAKHYASDKGVSLSTIIESYLDSITTTSRNEKDVEITHL